VRLVLDTDVLLAALLSPGLCRELLRKHLHAHTLVCSPALLREFEEKLRDKVGVEPAAVPLFTAYRQRVVMIEPASLSAPVCRDPDDDLVLATALAGQAADHPDGRQGPAGAEATRRDQHPAGAIALASLRDALFLSFVIRWCRRFAPQPPANGSEPSGFAARINPRNDLIPSHLMFSHIQRLDPPRLVAGHQHHVERHLKHLHRLSETPGQAAAARAETPGTPPAPDQARNPRTGGIARKPRRFARG
jgi:uncharacterized protein